MRYLDCSIARLDLGRASEQATDAVIPWCFVPASRHRAAAQGLACAWPPPHGRFANRGQALSPGLGRPMIDTDISFKIFARNKRAAVEFRRFRGDAGGAVLAIGKLAPDFF
jgi:hypothetical protein